MSSPDTPSSPIYNNNKLLTYSVRAPIDLSKAKKSTLQPLPSQQQQQQNINDGGDNNNSIIVANATVKEPTNTNNNNDDDDRLQKIADCYQQILTLLGETPRQGLDRTPIRAAKAMVELTQGYELSIHDVINDAVFDEEEINQDEIIIVKDIQFHSLCEHHLLPFHGKASIGYIPQSKILGLSKFARLVNMFAARLQVQERLTKQLCQVINEVLETRGVICHIEAEHSCMCMRGVKKDNSTTVTLSSEGEFKTNPNLKKEFLMMIRQ